MCESPFVLTTPLVSGQAQANLTNRANSGGERSRAHYHLRGGRLGHVMTKGGILILCLKWHNWSKWDEQSKSYCGGVSGGRHILDPTRIKPPSLNVTDTERS